PRRHVEAEDPDARRPVEVGQVHGPTESLQVLVEGVGDPDLADRRTDGTELEPARGQQVAELGVLGVGEVQDVRAVDCAELDRPDAMPRQDVNLLDGVLRDLVGKGTDADHPSLPRSPPWEGTRRDPRPRRIVPGSFADPIITERRKTARRWWFRDGQRV